MLCTLNIWQHIQYINSTSYVSMYNASARCIDVLALLWLVAHLYGQVGWVSMHLLSFILLLSLVGGPSSSGPALTLNIITEATQHIPIQYHHPLQMHFPSRGIVYDTVIFSPPQPLPMLVWTCYFANHTSPNSSHFLLFTYFGWQIPRFKIIYVHTVCTYYYEENLKLFNWVTWILTQFCGPWIQFSYSIHIHHDSETIGIALVVHTPTYTSWQLDGSENTVQAIYM